MDQAWHVHDAQSLIRMRAFDWLELLLLLSLVDKINREKGNRGKTATQGKVYHSQWYGY